MARSVFLYTDSRTLGGAEQALLTLIGALDQDAWRPTLLLDDVTGADQLALVARASNVPIRFIAPMPLGVVGARRVPSLVRTLREARPDVFHAHLSWPLAAKYPLLAAVIARVPAVVATVHLIPEFSLGPASFLQLRLLSGWVGRYIAVSRDIQRELTARFHWPQRQIEVVPNAVPTARFDVPASPRLRAWLTDDRAWPVVLTCARLHPQKGHAALLEAAARVPETIFAVAGEGPLRATLEGRSAELEILDRVRFLGFRTDVPDLLMACDVFALPSIYEGTSLALLEAMAARRPIVTSAIRGNDELIDDGETGLLVPPGDVDALAHALRLLLADADLRARLGRRARERVDRDFTPHAMGSRVMNVYEQLLNRTGKTSEQIRARA